MAGGRQPRAAPVLALVLLSLSGLGAASPASAAPSGPSALSAAVHLARRIGSRPAASPAERRAHAYVAKRFRAAGLHVAINGFRVPGRGRSRNVVGAFDGRRSCLKILMAHTDSVAQGPGADDNASGVGVLVALAPRLQKLKPSCDVWLVATGSEEREFTGTSYHVGARALVNRVRRKGRAKDLRYALSVDMVGRGKRFWLRSPRSHARRSIEGQVVKAGSRTGTVVRWTRDSGTGNSDHREFELASLPGANLEVWRGTDPCHHAACDRAGRLRKGALGRALRIVQRLARSG